MQASQESRLKALSNHLSRLQRKIDILETHGRRFFWYRLISVLIILSTLLISIFLFDTFITIISTILSIIVFSIIVYFHRRIDSWIRIFKIWKDIKNHQIAQIQLDWEQIPPPILDNQAQSSKSLQIDLDLSGRFSLHHLIDRSISIEGSNLLLEWLSQSKPNPQHIEKYQDIIRELVPSSLFRDKLTLNFQLVSSEQLRGDRLLKWLMIPYPTEKIKRLLPISSIIILVNIFLFVLNIMGYIPPYWIITLTLYAIFYFSNQKVVQAFIEAVVIFDAELDKFKKILDYLENFRYEDKQALAQLCSPFIDPTNPPSKILQNIKWVTAAIGMRSNPILTLLLNIIFPWDFYFSWVVSKYQKVLIDQTPIWLRALQELEASISLANYAYINPQYSFPQFANLDQSDMGPLFEAIDIGHPLISPEQKICNNFIINELGEVFIVTGSNMAGKSTFVKTIGINLILAYAGGPVNARVFKTNFFRLHTCIKISDSITDGFSYFYAEVKCLKNLYDQINNPDPYPILFLVDEIFRGTNNRERLIGSKAYIKSIAGTNCVGLIATHDLELAKLVDHNNLIKNFHLRDQVLDGKLVFDYKLRTGPSPTTNALKIMEMEGLPVED